MEGLKYRKVFEFITDGTKKPQKIEHGLDLDDVYDLNVFSEITSNEGIHYTDSGVCFVDDNILFIKNLPQLRTKGVSVKILLTYKKKSDCERNNIFQ